MTVAVSGRVALLLLIPALAAGQTPSQPRFRAGVDLVSFGVTVVNRDGGLATDLAAEDFEVRENGVPQQLEYFARGTDADAVPLHIGLLFDTSGSMERDLPFSRTAAIKFLRLFPQAEDFTLVEFNTDVSAARFTWDDFPRLVERIRSRPAKGFTALYDALGIYVAGAARQRGRKVLVLYTDGGDSSSAQSWSDTLENLRASDVTVYPLGFMEHQASFARVEQQGRLRQIADATGGRVFFPRSIDQLDAMYASVAAEMGAQYSLGYVSKNPAHDGQWRKVEITVRSSAGKRPSVRARKGYFAPTH